MITCDSKIRLSNHWNGESMVASRHKLSTVFSYCSYTFYIYSSSSSFLDIAFTQKSIIRPVSARKLVFFWESSMHLISISYPAVGCSRKSRCEWFFQVGDGFVNGRSVIRRMHHIWIHMIGMGPPSRSSRLYSKIHGLLFITVR